jgi:hypothetical protein
MVVAARAPAQISGAYLAEAPEQQQQDGLVTAALPPAHVQGTRPAQSRRARPLRPQPLAGGRSEVVLEGAKGTGEHTAR